jgi:hypothetical protein
MRQEAASLLGTLRGGISNHLPEENPSVVFKTFTPSQTKLRQSLYLALKKAGPKLLEADPMVVFNFRTEPNKTGGRIITWRQKEPNVVLAMGVIVGCGLHVWGYNDTTAIQYGPQYQ